MASGVKYRSFRDKKLFTHHLPLVLDIQRKYSVLTFLEISHKSCQTGVKTMKAGNSEIKLSFPFVTTGK